MSFLLVEKVLLHPFPDVSGASKVERAAGDKRVRVNRHVLKLVMQVLAEHANDDGTSAWPALETIATVAQVSRTQAWRALVALEAMGYIVKTSPARRNRPAQWAVVPHRLGVALSETDSEEWDRARRNGGVALGETMTSRQARRDSVPESVPDSVLPMASRHEKTNDDGDTFDLVLNHIVRNAVNATEATIRNPDAFRKKVLQDVDTARLERIIASHPGAPVPMLAGAAVGESSPYLRDYRVDLEQAATG